jgi:hypothetical protein
MIRSQIKTRFNLPKQLNSLKSNIRNYGNKRLDNRWNNFDFNKVKFWKIFGTCGVIGNLSIWYSEIKRAKTEKRNVNIIQKSLLFCGYVGTGFIGGIIIGYMSPIIIMVYVIDSFV